MKNHKYSAAACFFCCFFLFLLNVHAENPPAGETVRTRTENRFSAFEWLSKDGMETQDYPFQNRISKPLTEYNNFTGKSENTVGISSGVPVLSVCTGCLVPSVMPEIPEAGSLDFSSVPEGLITLFRDTSAILKEGDFSKLKTWGNGSFLPFLLESRLEKLPPVEDVFFAGIKIAGDRTEARSVFRLRFPVSSSAFVSVFAVVEAVLSGGEWTIRDIIFNGDSYEKAVKQTGA